MLPYQTPIGVKVGKKNGFWRPQNMGYNPSNGPKACLKPPNIKPNMFLYCLSGYLDMCRQS